MSDPKAECEALLSSVLPFAEQMLTDHGEFFPFGGAMRPDGQLVSVGFDGNEHPKSADVHSLLKERLTAAAYKGEYKATAIVYDVRVTLPASEEKSDAIGVSLDHRDSYSVIVYFPYKIDAGKPILGNAFAHQGAADIFPAQ